MPVGLVKRGCQFKAPCSHGGDRGLGGCSKGTEGELHLQAELGVSAAAEVLGFPSVVTYRWLGAQGKSFI